MPLKRVHPICSCGKYMTGGKCFIGQGLSYTTKPCPFADASFCSESIPKERALFYKWRASKKKRDKRKKQKLQEIQAKQRKRRNTINAFLAFRKENKWT